MATMSRGTRYYVPRHLSSQVAAPPHLHALQAAHLPRACHRPGSVLKCPVMAWFKKARKPIASVTAEKPSRVPEGLWVKCPDCAQLRLQEGSPGEPQRLPEVRPSLPPERRRTARRALRRRRVRPSTSATSRSTDPLQFTDTKPYRERLQKTIEATGMNDAVVVATGRLDGLDVVVAAMEYASSAAAWASWSARR